MLPVIGGEAGAALEEAAVAAAVQQLADAVAADPRNRIAVLQVRPGLQSCCSRWRNGSEPKLWHIDRTKKSDRNKSVSGMRVAGKRVAEVSLAPAQPDSLAFPLCHTNLLYRLPIWACSEASPLVSTQAILVSHLLVVLFVFCLVPLASCHSLEAHQLASEALSECCSGPHPCLSH